MSQTVQRQTNQMPAWLVFWGAAIGVVVPTPEHAESVLTILALCIRAGASDVAATVVPSDWALGLLCTRLWRWLAPSRSQLAVRHELNGVEPGGSALTLA